VKKMLMQKQPLEIRRASDKRLVATLTWHDKPKKTTVEGLTGNNGVVMMEGGLLDEE
jgi:hypothetical protein